MMPELITKDDSLNNEILNTILKNISIKAEWIGLRHYQEETSFRMARNGKNFRNSTSLQNGVMVEVLSGGQFAYFGTSDLSQSGIQKAAKQALRLCEQSAKFGIYKFDVSTRPAHSGHYQSDYKTSLNQLTPDEIQRRLISLSKTLKVSDEIFETSAFAMITQTKIHFVSTNGSNWSQDFQFLARDLMATAKKDELIQKRSLGLQARQWGAEALDLDELQIEAKRIGQQALELLKAQECPSEKMDIILMPDQLYLQVHESIGHPLELDRILGDERNYAGWSFLSLDDFGKLRYGPDILNVSFDPTLPGELASFDFDDNGVKTKKEFLIEKGILKRAIGGIESQKRSSVLGVSTSRSTSWNRPPIDRMSNINIEPGTSSLEEMISSTKKGLLLSTNRSWSIDDYRNKFQFGCEYAKLIEDGKITKTIRNPNYRGATVEFWNNLTHVGNSDTFEISGSPYCGKGEPNQIIRVGHAIPVCKFKNIEVFGGA